MLNLHRMIPAFALASLLTACGGNDNGPTFQPSPSPDAEVGGIWDGTGTSDLDPGIVVRIVGLIAEDGRAQYLEVNSNTGRPDFLDEGIRFGGFISAAQDAISGNIRIYAPVGSLFSGDVTAVDGTLVGVIVERSSIEGIWTAETGESGDFAQLFSDLYERDSSLSVTAGIWAAQSSLGASMALTINSDGTITGFDGNGCVFSSSAANGVVLIDPSFNIYEININITNCGPLNGGYVGLGYISSVFFPDDTFTMSVANASTAIVIEGIR